MTNDEIVLNSLKHYNCNHITVDPYCRDGQYWVYSYQTGLVGKQRPMNSLIMSPKSYSDILFKEKKKITFQEQLSFILKED